METELALGEGPFQSGDELAPKDPSQDGTGKKEAGRGGKPTGMVWGESAGGNDAMDMGMVLQLLIPGMEHTEEANLGAEMFRMGSDFEQGLGAGAEQQIVENLLVLQSQGRQAMREGENEVHVASGQDFAAARLDPTVAGVGLALGAVPIAAAVEGDDAMPAAGTAIQMSTKGGGSAALDGRQGLEMLPGEPVAAALDEFLSRDADEVGHLQGWSTHLGVPRRLGFLSRGGQRQRVQRAGGGVEVAPGKVQVETGLFQIMMT